MVQYGARFEKGGRVNVRPDLLQTLRMPDNPM